MTGKNCCWDGGRNRDAVQSLISISYSVGAGISTLVIFCCYLWLCLLKENAERK